MGLTRRSNNTKITTAPPALVVLKYFVIFSFFAGLFKNNKPFQNNGTQLAV